MIGGRGNQKGKFITGTEALETLLRRASGLFGVTGRVLAH